MLSGRDPSEALAVGGGLAAAAEARAGLDVRGDGTVGTGFAAASEALGWLRNDSHQGRLEALRKKYTRAVRERAERRRAGESLGSRCGACGAYAYA